jgi:integrase
MRELERHGTPAARALHWTILTAERASLGSTRSEIKSPSEFARLAKLPNHLVHGETWVVPAERMKDGKEHHVPLPKAALTLIAGRRGKLFLGHERQMMDLLNKLRPGFTVHSFRSSFADWAAEHDYPQELRDIGSFCRRLRGASLSTKYAPQQTARDDECVVKICSSKLRLAVTCPFALNSTSRIFVVDGVTCGSRRPY